MGVPGAGHELPASSLFRRQKALKYKLLGASWPHLRQGFPLSGVHGAPSLDLKGHQKLP